MQEMMIRAWKDPMYRSTLTGSELATLPASPAGMVELSDNELIEISGGTSPVIIVVTVITVLTAVVKSCAPETITGPTPAPAPSPAPSDSTKKDSVATAPATA